MENELTCVLFLRFSDCHRSAASGRIEFISDWMWTVSSFGRTTLIREINAHLKWNFNQYSLFSHFISSSRHFSKTIKIEVPYKIHTIHHHHTEKVPIVKKIEIPVIKGESSEVDLKLTHNLISYKSQTFSFHPPRAEVKVPYPVHVPVKGEFLCDFIRFFIFVISNSHSTFQFRK